MVILDLHECEGRLLDEIELRDDETGEEIPSEAVVGMIKSLQCKGLYGPWRYQVVKDGSTYLLFPLDKIGKVDNLGKVHYWPESPELVINRTLTFHDLYTELRRANSGIYWGSIPNSVDGTTEGLMAFVSRLPDGSYDVVTWSSLDGRFTVRWEDKGQMISLDMAGAPSHRGTRYAYNQ